MYKILLFKTPEKHSLFMKEKLGELIFSKLFIKYKH
jgi:hypothetical protein